MKMSKQSAYELIIKKIFHSKYKKGIRKIEFERDELKEAADKLKIPIPKNLGDLVYSFRYRKPLPQSINSTAQKGHIWIIRPAGIAKYRFVQVPDIPIEPNKNMTITKVPDATPGIIAKYALSDEQALLAKLRYNRLIDIFTGVTCYSLQNHLLTAIPGIGQVETDEIYVGIDKRGNHYIIPVQAKGGKDKLSIIQIEQDMALCGHKFKSLICRSIAAQFMKDDVIAMFEFEATNERTAIASEKHYKLVNPDDLTPDDLSAYRKRLSE